MDYFVSKSLKVQSLFFTKNDFKPDARLDVLCGFQLLRHEKIKCLSAILVR